ncbi:MAG: hypothetical protein IH875_10685, partial [Candidatus Dadabacteria bacterium]|nr:hypothetical protein [Candidatus Dadabacteria bacterium]
MLGFTEKALLVDPKYAAAMAGMAENYLSHLFVGCKGDPAEFLRLAAEWAGKALTFDENSAGAYSVLSMVSFFSRKFDEALETGERAVTLAPNVSDILAYYSWVLMNEQRFKESL